jgi:hypothetical protein
VSFVSAAAVRLIGGGHMVISDFSQTDNDPRKEQGAMKRSLFDYKISTQWNPLVNLMLGHGRVNSAFMFPEDQRVLE